VAIWTVHLEEGARFTLPPARDPRTGRTLYFFRGDGLRIDDTNVKSKVAIRLRSDAATELTATHGDVELLMLQGRPIGEPVASYGPFVMNNPAEIRQAFVDYERTRFGGWPWADAAPVHGRDEGRFAKRPDGSIERPPR
jgi:redox-sensitive bicupin YhaK (pirin superfamily)